MDRRGSLGPRGGGPLRVLHLTPEYPPAIWGGLGTAVGGLVAASARAGMAVGVLLVGGVLVLGQGGYASGRPTAGRAGHDASHPTAGDGGVEFFQVSPEDAVAAGVRFARRWRPDVVHLHSAWLWPVARAIRDRAGTPLVFTVHSLDRAEYEIGAFVNRWELQEAVIAEADRLIAISRSERALLGQYCPGARGRVRVVGNGIDDSPAARAAASRCARAGPPLVLYSGRFVERKGVRELLGAIPRVLDRAPETRFVLVGGYGGAAEIERAWMAEALRPHRRQVLFTGWLAPEEVAAWYRAADILVVPSWYEPFGMVVLEGMLHGLAIAATTVGGPAEILEDGRTGVLVPPKDVGGLTSALLGLIRCPDARRRLGAAAAAAVRQHWLWPRLVAQMRAVYEEVCWETVCVCA